MTITEAQPTSAATRPAYSLVGTLLEACSCGVLCPCWIGEDPDQGTCDAFIAYHFDRGEVDGVDVGGLNVVNVVHIPGNVLTPHSWKVIVFVDSKASTEQRDAILAAFTGKLGGPLADLAGLIGEVIAVESADIEHTVVNGAGHVRVANALDAEMAPFRAADGTITTLRDSIFSTVPGSPAYVSKASHHTVTLPQYGFEWEFEGRNATQADYRMEFMG